MKGWVWDTPYADEIPTPEHGHAYALTEKAADQPGFVKDEKTGLFVPEGSKLRPVKIGFQARQHPHD